MTLAALSLLCITTAYSQPPCTLKLADAPELSGFKLGMPVSDVGKKTRPHSSYYIEGQHGSGFGIISDSELIGANASGVRRVRLEYLDEKITSIEVAYDGSIKWDSAREFAQAVFEGLKLPATWKQKTGYGGDSFALSCSDFRVESDYGSGIIPTVKMYDTNAPGIVKSRKDETNEQKRKIFKP